MAESCVWAALTRAGLLRDYQEEEIEGLIAFTRMANSGLCQPLGGQVFRDPLAYQEGTYKIEVASGTVRFTAPLGSPSGHEATLSCWRGKEPEIRVDLSAMAQAEVEIYFQRLGIDEGLEMDRFGPHRSLFSVQSKNPAIGVAWVDLID